MNTEQKLASEFISSYGITDITAKSIKDALKVQGFTVIEYSRISNDENVENLIVSLGLKAYSLSVDAFTYADKNMRLVFILENLSEHEQLILLAHEQGHISCGHLSETTVSGQNVLHENQANEFAHYILSMAKHKGLYGSFLRNPRVSTVVLLLVTLIALIIAITFSIHSAINHEKSKSEQEFVPVETSQKTQEPEIQEPVNAKNVPDSTNKLDGLFSDENLGVIPDNKSDQTNTQQVLTENVYYMTKSGTKYHVASCSYIKSKDSLTVVTAEDINLYNYAPCSRCIK